MLKYAIRKDTKLSFTEGLSWTAELAEIEEAQRSALPTDVYLYSKIIDVEEDDGDDNWIDEKDEEKEGGKMEEDDEEQKEEDDDNEEDICLV
jgi:hypothetical protein